MINCTCPNCNSILEVDDELEGVPVECPNCRTPFEVPMTTAEVSTRVERACPYCGEMILAQAKKCRFCNEILDTGTDVAIARGGVPQMSRPHVNFPDNQPRFRNNFQQGYPQNQFTQQNYSQPNYGGNTTRQATFVANDYKPTYVVNNFQQTNVERKSRVAYVLLGLFLGGLGVHNFYAGYSGRGLAQLLINLLLGWLVIPLFIVGLWVLIEICAVTEDAQGNPMT